MLSAAVPSQAGSLVASAVDLVGAVTPKPCQAVPWPARAVSGVASVDVEAVSGEETEVASAAVSIVAAGASEAVTVDSVDRQTRRADLVVDMTVTAEIMVEVETAGAAADTVDATTTEDTAAGAATAEVIGPAPEATPCRLAKGTAETETEAETAAETETETETDIATATTAVTTRANGHTKEDQATKANANCAATDDKTFARLVVGIWSPLISLLSSFTSLASLTTRVSRRRQAFSNPGQLYTPCLKVKAQPIAPRTADMAQTWNTSPGPSECAKGCVIDCTRLISWSRRVGVNFASQRAGGRHKARIRTGSISPCKMMCFLYLPVTRRGRLE